MFDFHVLNDISLYQLNYLFIKNQLIMKNFLYAMLTVFAVTWVNSVNLASDLALYSAIKSGAVLPFAKIKWGALVVDGRGKVGGHVLAKNRNGAYIRTKVTPGNPQTVAQGIVRNNFAANAQGWRGLTAAQRQAWISAVSNFIGTNIFGDSKTLSGFQLYVRINNNLRFISESVLTAPPLPTAVNAFLTFSVVVAEGADTIVFTFTDPIDAGDKVIISATAPQSAGKYFVKSEYRKIAIEDNLFVTTNDVKIDYQAVFGAQPAEGTKVFFKMQVINKATGLAGAVISTSTITTA